jgi:deoxyxylulose-5-phosphate synthase
MKDGGRHHAISDYDDLREITKTLLDEVCREIKADILSNNSITGGR